MDIKKTIIDAVSLKEPDGADWAPGFLGTAGAYLMANPIKLPLLAPVYVPLAFLGLGGFVIYEGLNKIKERVDINSQYKKCDYLSELGKNLKADKLPELEGFMKRNVYADNRLAYSHLFSSLTEKRNKEGLLFVLDNLKIISKKSKKTEAEAFDYLVTDLFYSLTYNLKFMKDIMEDRVLQKFADSRNLPFNVDVAYYADCVPNIIADRPFHSTRSMVVQYLNTLPNNFKYDPEKTKNIKPMKRM